MEFKLRDRTITIEREEYDALMSELSSTEIELKPTPISPELDERLRKLEFCMMIIVGLVMVVFLLCKGN